MLLSLPEEVAPQWGKTVDAWMVVVTGGVDKLIGVLAGAFLIGESNAARFLA